MNWLLAAVIALLVIYALAGRRQGFIRTVFSMLSLLVALTVSVAVSPMISRMLKESNTVFEFVKSKTSVSVDVKKDADVADQMEAIDELKLPKNIKTALIEHNNSDIYKALGVESFQDYVLYYLTSMVINAGTFLIVFLVIRILLFIISDALNIIAKLPVLHELNKAAGIFAGILKGLLVLWILCIVLTVFGTTHLGQTIFAQMEDSTFLMSIYNNNLFLKVVTSLKKMLFL
ncbi:CvpA family protein [Anaerolentibacter hominis]|uniref:CvpA family protein n=1 Tax=Anaerolentibacter hominis TaxID=3079009 RepID=UPI0031B885B1